MGNEDRPDAETSGEILGAVQEPVQFNEAIAPDNPIASPEFTLEPEEAPPVKRGRGRPKKDSVDRLNSVTQAPPRAVLKTQPIAQIPVDYEAMANVAANLWFNTGELVLGEDWRPEPHEPVAIRNSFKDYFESEKVTKIPPAWGLAMVLFAYTAQRVTKPTIKTRIFGAYQWLKNKTLKR